MWDWIYFLECLSLHQSTCPSVLGRAHEQPVPIDEIYRIVEARSLGEGRNGGVNP